MSTYRQTAPIDYANDRLPFFGVDPMLAQGTVWLVEPGHPYDLWPAGLPAHGDPIKNLVSHHPEFTPEIGALPLKFATDGLLTGTIGRMERTTKGGLHIIVSQEEQGDLFTHVGNKYFAAIRLDITGLTDWGQYLYDTAYNHAFYMSAWVRFTRGQVAGPPCSIVNLSDSNSPSAMYNAVLFADSSATHLPAVGQVSVDTDKGFVKGTSEGAVRLNAVSSTGRTGSALAYPYPLVAPFIAGHWGAFNNYGTARENAPSMIFYRSTLEDLTISKRTFTEALEIDRREMAIAFAPSGRYHGDTFTDPATIP